jgi:succinylglutamic semialdehyde dehydrogenase
MARCLDEANVPSGVFGLVQGPGEYGALLASHPDVDGLMFTGSSSVGRRIVSGQGDRLDRLIALELGGKNASIALDDCDIELTARAVAFSAYVTAGQRCTATSRLIATSKVLQPLLTRIAQIARNLRVGYPLDESVFMGPVISESARSRLFAAQHAALQNGFKAIVPGGIAALDSHRGYYARPALHLAPGPDVSVPEYTDTELFAPDLAVYEVADADEAWSVANRSSTGLTAAVFTASRAQLERAADELRVGVLQWNRATAGASSRLPFGGLKDSGNHRPAGIVATLACSYPLGLQLPMAAGDARQNWPGFGE